MDASLFNEYDLHTPTNKLTSIQLSERRIIPKIAQHFIKNLHVRSKEPYFSGKNTLLPPSCLPAQAQTCDRSRTTSRQKNNLLPVTRQKTI
jgi:hypothetical protein